MEEYIKLQAILIQLYKEYVRLLGEEINNLAGLAFVHGWKSTNVEQGNVLQQIQKVNKQLKQLNDSST